MRFAETYRENTDFSVGYAFTDMGFPVSSSGARVCRYVRRYGSGYMCVISAKSCVKIKQTKTVTCDDMHV